VRKIDKAKYENVDVALDLKPIYDFVWSPDSRWLAYSKMTGDLIYQVFIADGSVGKPKCVSNGFYNDFHPVFSPCGKFLFFISNRRFDPTFCDFEWEMVYKKVASLYVLSLEKSGSFLPFKSDDEEQGSGDTGDQKEDKTVTSIDFDGIASRVEPLPLPRGNYRRLLVNNKSLFYLNRDEGDFNRFEFRVPGAMDLHAFSLDNHKEETVIEGISTYGLSADGSTLVYRKANTVGLIASSARKSSGEPLDLSDLKMHLDPKKEWKQIFAESWRMERDFYYEPGMHGLDWNAMKVKYGKLMDQATCRQDVQFIIGELIGELNTSHTYVFGGDRRRSADRVNVGMLGCDWSVDKKANRYRIKKIYDAPDWTRNTQPPLVKPGLNLKPGDYVLQVNGQEITTDRNIYSYFQDMAGKTISLLINSKPQLKDARTVVVKPLGGENTLRYFAWVEHNRMVCNKASNGQIGYMHLPDTYLGSSVMFPQYFYAQMNKKGLIIDGRFNGGGLDPDIFLRRLDKPVHAYWTRRYSHDQTIPDFVTRAHMVCLTNRQAGSGGDMLPMEFRKRQMGPIVGTRTWGGLVGVSMWLSMVDGGGLSAPDYRIYDHDGSWIVENEGVTPDHVVDLHPAEMARGYDAQLMKGIELLKAMIEKDPLPWPKHKPFRVDN
jgi:tricorn protease